MILPELEGSTQGQSIVRNSSPYKGRMPTKIELTLEQSQQGGSQLHVGNKMHKAFPLPGESSHWQYKFPLPAEDEPASIVRDDSHGEACPTDSGFIADQDRATIAKSSTLPRDSAPRVTSPAAEEGSMQQTINELLDFCTSLQRQHSELLAK
nr:hypothetical protein [Tanacetum cinerariifolium]